eukprot:99934_1
MSNEKSEFLKKKRELLKLTKKAIEEQCKSKKLSISGRKIDMIERLLNNPYVQPSVHDLSTKALKLLICGYIDKSMNKSEQNNADIINLCMQYYDRPLYIIILNNEELKLSLLDIATKDWKLTSNNVNIINKNEYKNFGGKKSVSICHKRDINIQGFIRKTGNNCKYNSCNGIFKAGGDREQYYNDCGLILYPNDIRPNDFDLYYYKLPNLPWQLSAKNELIYSNKFGLIYIASKAHYENENSRAHFGNIYSLNINKKNDKYDNISWETEQLPKPLRFYYHFSCNYCLINNNETEIFIVNGATDNKNYISQTSIYNLETKEYKILANNPKSNAFSGITYDYKSNKIYIAGGEGWSDVYCYDFHKNKYITDNIFAHTNKTYRNPKLYLNESGTTLHIANCDRYVRHEWFDLRANQSILQRKWKYNRAVADFKLRTEKQQDYISFIDFQ